MNGYTKTNGKAKQMNGNANGTGILLEANGGKFSGLDTELCHEGRSEDNDSGTTDSEIIL